MGSCHRAAAVWSRLGQRGREPAEAQDPAACLGTGWLPRAAGLLLSSFCLEKCVQNLGCLFSHLHMASCHLVEDVYACAMEILALTKLEAAVLAHVRPLNCMFVFWGFLVSVEKEL